MNRYRAVFISDLHLGSIGARASDIQAFLESIECEKLFLVGDIFDGWVGRSAKWDQDCNHSVRTILDQCKSGTQVFYTPGNHDAFMRRMIGLELGNMAIEHNFVHELANGRRMLVEHGDMFDRSCTHYPSVAFAGAWAYEAALHLNIGLNRARQRRNRRSVDFATALKRSVKRVSKRPGGLSDQLMVHAKSLGCEGVVCGHIHRPQIHANYPGFLYVNCGDWVEHGTAVVEHFDGRLDLISWRDGKATTLESSVGGPDEASSEGVSLT